MGPDRTRFDLQLGLSLSGGNLLDLWWRYASFGGIADAELLAVLVAGRADCGPHEHNLIAQALNEMFLDNGLGTFPVGYSEDAVGSMRREAAPHSADACRRASALVRHDARRASRRSRAINRESAVLVEVAARLVVTSRALTGCRAARRGDLDERRLRLTAAELL